MSTITQRAAAKPPTREVEFYVRAKTGPRAQDWSTIGVALARKNGQPGFSVKLNSLPISKDWDGGLVLVPPFVAEEETGDPTE